MTFPIVTGAVATRFTDTAEAELGTVASHNLKKWIYVQFKDAVTYVAGHSCAWKLHGSFTVTNDLSVAEDATDPQFAGIVAGVPTENQYGWLQFKGPYTGAVKDSNDTSIGKDEWMNLDSAEDGALGVYDASFLSATPLDAEVKTLLTSISTPIKTTSTSDDTADTVDVMML